MPILPADIPTGTLTGQFYFVTEDSSDADTKPDVGAVVGTVVIKPSIPILRMASKKASLIPLEFTGEFDSQGYLVSKGTTVRGFPLPSCFSTVFDTTGWYYTATFNLRTAGTNRTVNLEPVSFQITENQTIDLSEIIPAPQSPGVITIRGEKGDKGDPGDASTGGGTSGLTLGTTAGTAKPGDWVPSWTQVTSKPTTFAPSAHTHAIADLPAGIILAAHWDGNAWPSRPTARTDVTVNWIGGTTDPPGALVGDTITKPVA